MKILFSLMVLLISTSSFVYGQSLKSILESKIERTMRVDSESWKASNYIYNSANITSSKENEAYLIIGGDFTAKITKWPFKGNKKIPFQAKVKVLLGEPTITKIWWTQPILNSIYCIGDCD